MQIARMCKLAKSSAAKARTRAVNQLKAFLVSADPNPREELAGQNNAELFRTCAGFAGDSKNDEDGEMAVLRATRITLGLLAQRIGQLTEQIQGLEGHLARPAERHAPQLLTVVGIGPDASVTLLITMGDNPERVGSEASFALDGSCTSLAEASGERLGHRSDRHRSRGCPKWVGWYGSMPDSFRHSVSAPHRLARCQAWFIIARDRLLSPRLW
ncbi:hypothetical protein [Streptomyces mirabilis]|uniref:hypothetical protein n=1 Tax=Streptomyces mirabilis TaxID=68239 RepID=UPI0033BDB616